MLYLTSFPLYILQLAFSATDIILRPYLWSLDQLASIFLPTTIERDHMFKFIIKSVVLIIPCLFLQVILILPSILVHLIKCLLSIWRRPYTLSVSQKSASLQSEFQSNSYHPVEKFSVVTANVCLLPESLSRFNNLSHTKQRSRKIGERFVIDQYFYQNMMRTSTQSSRYSSGVKKHTHGVTNKEDLSNIKEHIATHFPQTDFLCLQETWDRDYSKVLISELHKVFPWILYDIRIDSFNVNYFMFNSGLMFASKYPIIDVDFKSYNSSCKQCVFNSKGLLMVKVQVSYTKKESRVGYIFNTHLQAYQGKNQVINKQLDDIMKWTEEFRRVTKSQSDEILFDVLCGDFNFDNMSPGDKLCFDHPIFLVYEDFGRLRNGKDKEWTIGTEMRQKYLWDKQVITPEGLKEALQDPVLRQQYVVDGDIELCTLAAICKSEPKRNGEGQMMPSDVGGKRRIDYVLYRKDSRVNIENYRFITRLATLSDHIPVCMEFTATKKMS